LNDTQQSLHFYVDREPKMVTTKDIHSLTQNLFGKCFKKIIIWKTLNCWKIQLVL